MKQLNQFLVIGFIALGLFAQPLAFADQGQMQGAGGSAFDGVDDFLHTLTLGDLRHDINKEHGLKISPYISQTMKLTDNVFGAPDNGNNTSEIIWATKPGVRITHKGDYGSAGINYNATLKYFSRFGKQNEQDNFFTSWVNLKTSENTYIQASETLNQVSSTAAVESVDPTNFLDSTFALIAGYNTEKTDYAFGYRMFDRDFSTTAATHFNYNEDIYSLTATHDLSEYADSLKGYKGTASLRLGNVEYSKSGNRDAFWYEIPVGVQGPFIAETTLSANVGIYARNQENPNRNDVTWITTNIAVSKVFDNRTKVVASFKRYPQESTFGGSAVSDNKKWSLDVKHVANEKLRLRGNASYSNMDIEQSSFIGQRAIVNGFFIFIPSNRVKRQDDTFALNLGADYKLSKSTRLHADYNLTRRDSNISSLDMTENSLTLRASVAV